MLQEEKTDRLLNAIYKKNNLNVYDFCAEERKDDNEIVVDCKAIADELVDEKLAKYTDEEKTEMSITNYGRYWVAHGGYFVYLKEGEKKIKSEHDKHHDERVKHNEELSEELKEARLKFTHYRIVTYWWGFILTIISFLLSMLNLYLILKK